MKEFYLAGGTGLALQLWHRRSLDLDFFQRSGRERIFFSRVAKELTRLFGFGGKRARLELKQVDQAVWNINDTRVTFLAYPFPLIYQLIPGSSIARELAGLLLATPKEIALMKAYALGRRATFRDYLDLYFLLHRRIVTLDEIVREASRKFIIEGEEVFSAKLFLEQLVYLDDIEDKDISVELLAGQKEVSVKDVEGFLRSEVQHFLKRQIAPQEGITS